MSVMALVRHAFSLAASSMISGACVETRSASNHAQAASDRTAIAARMGRELRLPSRRDVLITRIANTRAFYRTVYILAGARDTPAFVANDLAFRQLASSPRRGTVRSGV